MPASPAAARAQQIAEEAEAHFAAIDKGGPPKLFIPGTFGNLPRNNNLGFKYGSVEEAFPDVDPGLAPAGNLVLLQIRQPMMTTESGLVLDTETRKTELDNTQVAKVVAVGGLAFRNRDTGNPWPEGAWCGVGDYVRIPKYQGDRMARSYKRVVAEVDEVTGKRRESVAEDQVHFVLTKDLAIVGKYPSAEAALAERAYL